MRSRLVAPAPSNRVWSRFVNFTPARDSPLSLVGIRLTLPTHAGLRRSTPRSGVRQRTRDHITYAHCDSRSFRRAPTHARTHRVRTLREAFVPAYANARPDTPRPHIAGVGFNRVGGYAIDEGTQPTPS